MKSKSIFLETQRLVLNSPNLLDLDNIIRLRTNPEVMRYIGSGDIQTESFIKQKLIETITYQEKYRIGFYSVFDKNTGEFVGQAGLFHLGFDESQTDIELAYRLLPKYWGQGHATELAKALVDYGFSNLDLDKLVAATHSENIASKNVLKKSGFIDVGEVPWYNMPGVIGFEVYKNDAIELVPYSSSWPKEAAQEIEALKKLLPKNLIDDIQHIGSTSIPGLSAKPIIDIELIPRDFEQIKPIAIEQLKKLGYVYWDENPDPERLFFVKGMPPYGSKRTYHVHIMNKSSPKHKDKVIFRHYLKSHPEAIADYENLKQNLASKYKYDRELYTQEKAVFINAILDKANS